MPQQESKKEMGPLDYGVASRWINRYASDFRMSRVNWQHGIALDSRPPGEGEGNRVRQKR